MDAKHLGDEQHRGFLRRIQFPQGVLKMASQEQYEAEERPREHSSESTTSAVETCQNDTPDSHDDDNGDECQGADQYWWKSILQDLLLKKEARKNIDRRDTGKGEQKKPALQHLDQHHSSDILLPTVVPRLNEDMSAAEYNTYGLYLAQNEGVLGCENALPHFTSAIELSPRMIDAYNNKGLCLRILATTSSLGGKPTQSKQRQQYHLESAVEMFQTALALGPSYHNARINLAVTYSMMNPPQIHLAKQALQYILSKEENNPSALSLLQNLEGRGSISSGIKARWSQVTLEGVHEMTARNSAAMAAGAESGTPNIVLIIPFRQDNDVQDDRTLQLQTLIDFMEVELPKWTAHFQLLVVEQEHDGLEFNRGALCNAGFRLAISTATNSHQPESFIFHDVDLLPDKLLLPFYARLPRHQVVHLASTFARYQNVQDYLGGIVAVSELAFKGINGFPNNFWGWGVEDTEFLKRIQATGLDVVEPVFHPSSLFPSASVFPCVNRHHIFSPFRQRPHYYSLFTLFLPPFLLWEENRFVPFNFFAPSSPPLFVGLS